MRVWQSVQGVSSDEPAFIPCTVPAATGLWHWLHSTLMFGIFSIRAFCEPCGVWHPMHPSPFTGVCSYTNGPRISVWHLVQIRFESFLDLRLLFSNVPCTSWQSLHLISPSFTLWWKGISNCGFTSVWHWKQSVGWEAFRRCSVSWLL